MSENRSDLSSSKATCAQPKRSKTLVKTRGRRHWQYDMRVRVGYLPLSLNNVWGCNCKQNIYLSTILTCCEYLIICSCCQRFIFICIFTINTACNPFWYFSNTSENVNEQLQIEIIEGRCIVRSYFFSYICLDISFLYLFVHSVWWIAN